MKDYWPGYAIAAVGLLDYLLGGQGWEMFVGWGAGFNFGVLVARSRH